MSESIVSDYVPSSEDESGYVGQTRAFRDFFKMGNHRYKPGDSFVVEPGKHHGCYNLRILKKPGDSGEPAVIKDVSGDFLGGSTKRLS